MKYFQLLLNSRYDAMPRIRGWSEKYDTRFINENDSHKLPYRELLFVDPNENMIFPDILSFPFFLVTEKILNIIKIYEPGIVYKQVILLDGQYAKSKTYFLPILKSVDCLHSNAVWKRDGEPSKQIILDHGKLGKEAIFRPLGAPHTIAIIRLDIAESILRRDAKGIGLVPVEIKMSSEEGK